MSKSRTIKILTTFGRRPEQEFIIKIAESMYAPSVTIEPDILMGFVNEFIPPVKQVASMQVSSDECARLAY